MYNTTIGNITLNNNGTPNGNGLLTSSSTDKESLTPSPPTRLNNDDVKSEPMELVCSGNNPSLDEHSNDSVGDNDMNHSGDIKGSLR